MPEFARRMSFYVLTLALLGSPAVSSWGAEGSSLDLSDPAQLVDAYIRTVGDNSGEETFVYATVVVMAMVPGERGRKLFGVEVLGATRFYPIEGGYQRLHREVGLYTDLETGEVLSHWQNPWTNESVEPIHIQNDPVNFRYTVAQQSGPRRIVYDDLGEIIAFHREVLLRYPNAINPRDYPKHSSGEWYEAAELFNSFALRAELENPELTSVSEYGTWARQGPWLPWMEMGDHPGHLLYHGRSKKLMNGVAELPQPVLAYIQKHLPEYLHAPEEFTEPNETSWTVFKKVIDSRRAESSDVP